MVMSSGKMMGTCRIFNGIRCEKKHGETVRKSWDVKWIMGPMGLGYIASGNYRLVI